jgi:microsomal epoxide hydrolase
MANGTLSRRSILGGAALPLANILPASAAEPAAAAGSDDPNKVTVRPFKIAVPQPQLDDIMNRVRNVRWPDAPRVKDPWQYGASLEAMKDLQKFWLTEYKWREQEAKLNAFPQFKAQVAGYDIHFVHVKGSGKNPTPIILSHGWPGSFIEFTRAVDQMAHPEKYGGSEDDAFSIVIPSLPGFGFSSKPLKPMGGRTISRLFDRLMVEGLGYTSYLAQGGDFGANISVAMTAESEHCKAANINLLLGVGSEPQNAEEREAQKTWDKVYATEGAYQHIQRTKPLSLAYGMSDSPIGIVAWLLEKYRTWSGNPYANPWGIYPKSQFLNIAMVYIVTNTMGTSTWMYAGGGSAGGEEELPPRRPAIEKPNVGVTHFPTELVFWPRSYAERTYNLVYWADVAAGGHFAAFEQPDLFALEMRDFRSELRKRGIWT